MKDVLRKIDEKINQDVVVKFIIIFFFEVGYFYGFYKLCLFLGIIQ